MSRCCGGVDLDRQRQRNDGRSTSFQQGRSVRSDHTRRPISDHRIAGSVSGPRAHEGPHGCRASGLGSGTALSRTCSIWVAVATSRKLLNRCEPSHKGLSLDRPQRHNAITRRGWLTAAPSVCRLQRGRTLHKQGPVGTDRDGDLFGGPRTVGAGHRTNPSRGRRRLVTPADQLRKRWLARTRSA